MPSGAKLPEIANASVKICLLLLATGSARIWRSNDEAPSQPSDRRAFLTVDGIGLNFDLLRDTLDTPLFRGEGESFEPIHRTIAEYLGAKYLAQRIQGSEGTAALPLSRALALITDIKGVPPTDLRGVFGWLATHLAANGYETAAKQLIKADAVAVLNYGDAAAFTTSARRLILERLDKDDPYFLASDVGTTTTGGLIGDDLVPELLEVLSDKQDRSHKTITVLEALEVSKSPAPIHGYLKNIALDPARPDWQRWRAAEIWVRGEVEPSEACATLLDDLHREPVSISREALRTHLAGMDECNLATESLRALLGSYASLPTDNTVGRLLSLRLKLERQPPKDLFDAPVSDWMPKPDPSEGHRFEVLHLLDGVLAATINSAGGDGASVWRWLTNASPDPWASSAETVAEAVAEWLEAEDGREAALFAAALDASELGLLDNVRLVPNHFAAKTRKWPTAESARYLLTKADNGPSKKTKGLLEIATAVASAPNFDVAAYWEVYHRVERQLHSKRLLQEFSRCRVPQWRFEQAERQHQRQLRLQEGKARNIEVLSRDLVGLRTGRLVGYLAGCANIILTPNGSSSENAGWNRWAPQCYRRDNSRGCARRL